MFKTMHHGDEWPSLWLARRDGMTYDVKVSFRSLPGSSRKLQHAGKHDQTKDRHLFALSRVVK